MLVAEMNSSKAAYFRSVEIQVSRGWSMAIATAGSATAVLAELALPRLASLFKSFEWLTQDDFLFVPKLHQKRRECRSFRASSIAQKYGAFCKAYAARRNHHS